MDFDLCFFSTSCVICWEKHLRNDLFWPRQALSTHQISMKSEKLFRGLTICRDLSQLKVMWHKRTNINIQVRRETLTHSIRKGMRCGRTVIRGVTASFPSGVTWWSKKGGGPVYIFLSLKSLLWVDFSALMLLSGWQDYTLILVCIVCMCIV